MPEAANFFHFALAATDVQLLVGYIDLGKLHEAATQLRSGGKAPAPLSPEITHRFFMSLTGFESLKRQIDEMAGLIGKARESAAAAVLEDDQR
jgi:hypothetical protein